MLLLLISVIAGVITVMTPCVLPLLPVVIGTAAAGRGKWTPYVVIGSLSLSIILFTFALKASTTLIDVPPGFWTGLSGSILLLFGVTLTFPSWWARLPGISFIHKSAQAFLGRGFIQKNTFGDVMIGASLGPIFSTCSPTYFVILATVLPASMTLGVVYLLSYVSGLALALLLIAFVGQHLANRLAVVASTNGIAKRTIGLMFIVLGIMIMAGYEKRLETRLLAGGFFDATKLEHLLLGTLEEKHDENADAVENQCAMDASNVCANMDRLAIRDAIDGVRPRVHYAEIATPSAFLNTNGKSITIREYIDAGNVVLIDFLTYSCVNCRAVIPHLNRWHGEYADDGLVVIGIHAPEFAFERERSNVEKALASLGVKFPVVMDNDFATWRAYGNRYWPHLYLIDREGNIVYDHAGEGSYEETEAQIRHALGLE